jgi:hypothetical protein
MRPSSLLSVSFALGLLAAAGCNSTASPVDSAAEGPVGTAVQRQVSLPPIQCVTVQRDVLGTVNDAQISGANTSKNYGASWNINTGEIGGGARQILLQFDPGELPPMLELAGARISLPVREAQGNTTISAYQVLVPWDEATVTWDSFYASPTPYEATAPFDSFDVTPTTKTVQLDITDFAYAVGATGTPNYGVLLTQQDNGSATLFWSSDYPGPDDQPRLDVCFYPDLCADVSCPTIDPCTPRACDPATGQCAGGTPSPDGAACDDGNPQTSNDVCTNGLCAGSSSGYVYPLFAGGPGFACPTGATVWTSSAPRDPTDGSHAKAACEACYGAGNCHVSDEDGGGVAWGPAANPATCGEAYFSFTDGATGNAGRAFAMCASSTTFGTWGL